jgi:hypothetical protein
MGKKVLIIKHAPLKLFIQCMPAFAAIRKFHSEDEVYILTEKSLVGICKRSKLFNKVWLDAKRNGSSSLALKTLQKGCVMRSLILFMTCRTIPEVSFISG